MGHTHTTLLKQNYQTTPISVKSGPFDTWGPYVIENRWRTLGGSHSQTLRIRSPNILIIKLFDIIDKKKKKNEQ